MNEMNMVFFGCFPKKVSVQKFEDHVKYYGLDYDGQYELAKDLKKRGYQLSVVILERYGLEMPFC